MPQVPPRYCKGGNRDKTRHITLPNRTYPPQVSPPPCAKSGNPLSCLGKSGYSRDQNPGPNYTIASTLASKGGNRDKTRHITLPNRTYPPQVSPPPCAKLGTLLCLGKSGYNRDQNLGLNYTTASTLAMVCQLG
jgi:hypothetical protein